MPFLGTGDPKIGQKVCFSDFLPFSGAKKIEHLELRRFHRFFTLSMYRIRFFFILKEVLGSNSYEYYFVPMSIILELLLKVVPTPT